MGDKNKSSPAMQTRGRKGSSTTTKENLNLSDISALIHESEARIKDFVKTEIGAVNSRLERFEATLFSVKNDCERLEVEVSKIKQIINEQQIMIEKHESKIRECNIIVHNIPEGPVLSGTDTLREDKEKMLILCRTASLNVKAEDMRSFERLGKRQPNKNRPLKITMKSSSQKFELLNKRKFISSHKDVIHLFDTRIYLNSDSSLLVRREEFRLRQRLKDLKHKKPDASSYIRSGVLYHDGEVLDKVDVKKQLF